MSEASDPPHGGGGGSEAGLSILSTRSPHLRFGSRV